MKSPQDDPRLPPPDDLERLRDDLRALYGEAPRVPASVDEEILARWREEELALARRRVFFLRVASAAAAAVLLAAAGAWLVPQLRAPRGPEEIAWVAGGPAATALDLDASGRVDILDAFWLARRIEKGGDLDIGWDLDGDGVVDLADVDLVARAAVRVT